nr:hypothetical protein [Sphingobium sp. OAS761]
MLAWIGIRLASDPDLPLPPDMARTRTTSTGQVVVRPPLLLPASPSGPLRARAGAAVATPVPGAWIKAAPLARINVGAPVDLLDFIHFSVAFANRHYGDDRPVGLGRPIGFPAMGPPLPAPLGAATDRWQASAWLLWRPDHSDVTDIATAGRLGASQAGTRIAYRLTAGAHAPASAYARASVALEQPAAPELAAGIALQPDSAIPVSIAAERRIALGKGGRDAFALMAVGGFGPTPVTAGIAADGYAQAGVVGLRQRDIFVDGKLSLLHPLPGTGLRIGATLSGGVQPGIGRLDIGPEIRLRLPLPRMPARLSVEWRQRVAGHARPVSGLAVTIAADF